MFKWQNRIKVLKSERGRRICYKIKGESNRKGKEKKGKLNNRRFSKSE